MDESKSAIDFENDKTLRFIYDYLKNSIKITGEKWNRFVKKEENKLQLSTFLTDQAAFKLIFFISKDGNIHCSKTFPLNSIATKACFFIKRNKNTFITNNDEQKSTIFFGSISKFAFKQFDLLLNDIRFFFSTNKQEENKVSIRLFDELKFYLNHIQSLTYSFLRLDNNYNNEGIFPKLLDKINNFSENKDLKEFEELVILWLNQLKEKINDSLSLGSNSTNFEKNIETELNLVPEQTLVLDILNNQLEHPLILKISNILTENESAYENEFKNNYKNLIKLIDEIEDRNVHLLTFKIYHELMKKMSFEEIDSLIKPVFHNLSLIWSFSQHFKIPKNYCYLLQLFFNFIIEKAS
jgi:hypothetical protein